VVELSNLITVLPGRLQHVIAMFLKSFDLRGFAALQHCRLGLQFGADN